MQPKGAALGLALFLAAVPCSRAPRAQEVAADFRLQQVRIENDGSSFHMFIPLVAHFADFSLDSPPRIILDLDQTTSYMPKAPGLYQVRLDRGPVVSLRTSQYRYSPLDHRVRLALELSRVVPYQVLRVKGGIEVRLPDPEPRMPRALLVGSSGVSAIEDEPVPAPSAKPASETAPPPLQTQEANHSEPAPSEEVSQFRTLRQALAAAVGERNVYSLDPDKPDEPIHSDQDRPAECAPGEAGSSENSPLRPDAGTPSIETGGATPEEAQYFETPAAYTLPPSRSPAMTGSSESLPAAAGPASSSPEASSPARRPPDPSNEPSNEPSSDPSPDHPPAPSLGLPLDAVSSDAEPIPPPSSLALTDLPPPHPVPSGAVERSYIVPGDPKETAAARLLHMAAQSLLQGDEAKARKAAERAHHFYGATQAGHQAAMLLRELLVLQGKEIDADQLGPVDAAPDTARIPVAVFLRLVHHYEERAQLMEVDRLLREWGPAYGPLASLSSLHLALGEAFLRARRTDLARTHLEMVPPADPSEPRALALLAQAEDESGDKEKALELYRHLSTLPAGPCQVRGLVRAADLEFQLGRTSEALEAYEKFLEGKPPADEEPWALYQVANCHLLLGDAGLAKVRYEAVVGRWPGSTWAGFAQDQLEEMKWRAELASKNTSRKNSSTSR